MTIPTGTFKVGSYDCYLISLDLQKSIASVGVSGYYDLLRAERAAFMTAKLLNTSSVSLERWGSSRRYTCRVDDVKLKEIEKWLS